MPDKRADNPLLHATRGNNAGTVESLGAIEKRIVREIGDALRRLGARMSQAEAYAEQRERERAQERTHESALDRAAARWRMNS
jgi:hypothetical protein